jgi:glycosyltransferase involved in cell wall biosynthesis
MSQIAKSSNLSVVLITRDHSDFILECLESIQREFSQTVPVFIVDVGSKDETLSIIEDFTEENFLTAKVISTKRELTPLDAFRVLIGHIETDYISVISGDDFFLNGYGALVNQISTERSGNVLVQFAHAVVDHQSKKIGERVPRWTSNPKLDRKKILYSNPGATAGSLLPWKILVEKCLDDKDFNTMIEDYYFSCKLISSVTFKTVKDEVVAYRHHPNNLMKNTSQVEYVLSLGICVRLAWNIAKNPIEKLTTLFLFFRWGRKVPMTCLPAMIRGFFKQTI